MNSTKDRCLLLACGNTLRADDGIGPWLADWARQRFEDDARLTIISRQQWTPELAADVANADTVLFVDCSTVLEAGQVNLADVQPAAQSHGVGTHQVSAAELLGMAQELYAWLPRRAQLLTIGAGSTELSEEFSPAVLDAIPVACERLEHAIEKLLTTD